MNKFLEKIVKAWENKEDVAFAVRLENPKKDLVEANVSISVIDENYDKDGRKIYILLVNDWEFKIYMHEDENITYNSEKDIYTISCGGGVMMDFLFA